MTSNPPSSASTFTKEISPKLRKTIERLQTRIKESPDYEVHQELKAVTTRYLRVQDYGSAVQLLYIGAELLLENKLGASGADITLTLIDVYNTAHMKPDSTSRARIVQLLGMMDPSEPNRARIIHEAIQWSAKEGDIPFGDPELHHSIGVLLAGDDDVYAAEKHLLLGTKSSPPVLAKLLYEYFLEDAPHTAGIYISRAVLPYLCLQNLRDAQTCLKMFIESLISGENVPPHSTIEGVQIFPSLPHLNFLSLLLVACQRGAPEFFTGLKKQYATSLKEVQWDDVRVLHVEADEQALAKIGEVWFGIKIPRPQGNMMSDLLGSLFKTEP